MSAALDSTAGLIKLVAILALNGRDKELGDLIGTPINDSCEGPVNGKGGADPVGTIKGHIEKGRGIGERTILAIYEGRGVEAKTRRSSLTRGGGRIAASISVAAPAAARQFASSIISPVFSITCAPFPLTSGRG